MHSCCYGAHESTRHRMHSCVRVQINMIAEKQMFLSRSCMFLVGAMCAESALMVTVTSMYSVPIVVLSSIEFLLGLLLSSRMDGWTPIEYAVVQNFLCTMESVVKRMTHRIVPFLCRFDIVWSGAARCAQCQHEQWNRHWAIRVRAYDKGGRSPPQFSYRSSSLKSSRLKSSCLKSSCLKSSRLKSSCLHLFTIISSKIILFASVYNHLV